MDMKQNKKILRIRPFNMANFSSGAGFLAFGAIMSALFVIPINFFIWCGITAAITVGEDETFHDKAKRQANRVLLPITIVGFLLIIFLGSEGMQSYFRSPTVASWLGVIVAAGFPTLGYYGAVRLIIASFGKNLNAINLLISAFIVGFPLGIIGLIATALIAEGVASILAILITIAVIALLVFGMSKGLE